MKKILTLTLCILLILNISLPCFAVSNTNSNVNNYAKSEVERLTALGILDGGFSSQDLSNCVTRIDALKAVLQLINVPYDSDEGSDNDDNAIIFGRTLGIIAGSENDTFGSDRNVTYYEIIKMLVCAIGYKVAAEQSGGYPVGYLATASKLQLTKYISPSAEGTVTFGDLFVLLDNALEAKCPVQTHYGDKAQYEFPSGSSDNNTLMYKYYDITKTNVSIIEVDSENKRIKVSEKGNINYYEVSDSIELLNVAEVETYIYINNDGIVLYILSSSNTKVIYDYIFSVNGREDRQYAYSSSHIKKLYLRNADDEYSCDDDLTVYYNDEKMVSEELLVGSYARVVIKNDKIMRIDVYSLSEGGLLYHASPSMIKYVYGERNEMILSDIQDADITIIIDGVVFRDMFKLETDMVFDYWTNGEKDKYLFVASSRKAIGSLDSFANGFLTVEDKDYEISSYFPLYMTDRLENYKKDKPLNAFLGKSVEIFIDDNKCVRYMRSNYAVLDPFVFNGIITGASRDNGLKPKRKLKVYNLDSITGEKEYDVDQKLENSPISFEHAASKSKDYEGNGVFQFTINSDNIIIKIDHIPHYGHVYEKSTQVSATSEKLVCGGVLYQKAKPFVIVDIDGQFTVKPLNWNTTVVGMGPISGETVKFISDYDIKEKPLPSLLIITGETDRWYDKNETKDLVTNVSNVVDVDGETLYRYTMISGKKVTVSEEFHRNSGIVAPSFVCYYGSGWGKDPIYINKAYNLSGSPENWNTDVFSRDSTSGFFAADGMAFHNDLAVQFIVNGELTDVYPQKQDYNSLKVYQVFRTGNKTKFTPSPSKLSRLGAIQESDKIWFYVQGYPAPRAVVYVLYMQ